MKNNIKVGILNYQYSNHNYGAVLQACALEYVLKKNNIYSEHIDYIPLSPKKNILSFFKSYGGSVLRNLGLRKMIIPHSKFKNPDVFEDARNRLLTRTFKKYRSYDDLFNENFDHTHMIVGSDQVWRPSYTENSMMIYFLDFLKPECKRISYAASFGTDSWEFECGSSETVKAREALKKFSAISVRERSGVDICDKVFSIQAEHVLDPTLLAGSQYFSEVANKSKYGIGNSGKIIYYKLDSSEKFNEFLGEIKRNKRVEIENIYFKKIDNHYYYYPVDDWLSKIKNSELVITDSFHCICFALLFNKEFIYYPNENNRGMSRIESLLSELNITNRIFNDKMSLAGFLDKMEILDYSVINKKLEDLRVNSLAFLLTSLK